MIKVEFNMNWKWFIVELTVFAAIVVAVNSIVPTAWFPTAFFVVGYLACVWDSKYSRAVKRGS